jgi:DNA-binding response OmpR family regulator|eukprot:TRINITY_DN5715_c0_g1_i1.p2 TRINITY_DN5715_c0_g1~~TRINITY_DN5715_c0_g1_i1.p2  ORF type:complete len:128 (+),score=30.35 TRINITY_DN5715_c0_g1_i1:254-637(+)
MSDTPKILVVDDDEHILRSLSQYLELEDFNVVSASSGPEALTLFAQEKPDLLVLDVMMPGMDGFQVLEKLRGDPETASVPVLMLTARDQHNDILKGYQMGATSYLVKPFNLDELVEAIREVFASKSS